MGIDGNLWLTAQSMLKDMKGAVKWQDQILRSFTAYQGVLQGGSASPNLHKVYENPLLKRTQENNIGLSIGTIYMGMITVADDKALLNISPEDLDWVRLRNQLRKRREIYQRP
jgi:hypothetical protein